MTDRNRDYDEYADSPEYYNIDPYTEPRQDAPQDDFTPDFGDAFDDYGDYDDGQDEPYPSFPCISSC